MLIDAVNWKKENTRSNDSVFKWLVPIITIYKRLIYIGWICFGFHFGFLLWMPLKMML